MRKRPSYWPAERRLFRDKAKRGLLATGAVWLLSIVAAVLLVSVPGHPGP